MNEDNGTDLIEREVTDTESVIGAIARTEVDVQIATAKSFPRSIKRFLQQSRELVTLNVQVAEDCLYTLERTDSEGRKKPIEGPSARFAEIALSCWGNSHGGARVVSEDAKFVTGQGVVWDLERNVRVSFEVRRRITNKYGKRYNDDMVVVTGNAAASIAFRNAVLKVIPKAIWHPVWLEARKCAVGDATTLKARRTSLVSEFGKIGVSEQQILDLIEKQGVEDIGLDDLARLRGVYTAVRDGEHSIESIFGGTPPADGSRVRRSELTPDGPKKAAAATAAAEPESSDADVAASLAKSCDDASQMPAKVRKAIAAAKAAGSIDQREADALEVRLQARIDAVKKRGK